jgi:uncharacterized RDD family membrane protein YckC
VKGRHRRVIVTPEHVEIHLDPAGLGSRFVALLVDFVVVTSLSATVSQLTLVFLPTAPALLVRALLLLVLTWGYHVYFEVRHAGRSPGKRMMGLRVVDGRGLPLGVEQSFVRNVVRVLDAAPLGYAFGALVAQFDRERRRLGDIAADTLVVREARTVDAERRTGRTRAFNSLRTPRLLRLARHRVTLEEREFLSELCRRADGLEERARFDLMEEVGRHYRARLEIDDPHLSGESLVRGLTAVLESDRAEPRPEARRLTRGRRSGTIAAPR